MTTAAVEEYLAAVATRYRAASKRRKGQLLDEICATTGLHRKSIIRRLGRSPARARRRRGRPRRYGPEVAAALVPLWELSDRLCGKLLAPLLPQLLAALERHGELRLSPSRRAALEALSPATIDRMLRPHRPPRRGAGPRAGGPTATLRAQVPLRTFGEWRGVAPGALQADLVLHSGARTHGFYLTTVVAVDVATGWTELQPVRGMGKQRVGTAVHHLRQRMPFPVQSLHTDNGGEFLNHLLVPWCRREGIHFTRGRGSQKNDQAWVEQRNWLAVLRRVGYERYASRAAYAQLEALYPPAVSAAHLPATHAQARGHGAARGHRAQAVRRDPNALATRACHRGAHQRPASHPGGRGRRAQSRQPSAPDRPCLDTLWALADDARSSARRRAGLLTY